MAEIEKKEVEVKEINSSEVNAPKEVDREPERMTDTKVETEIKETKSVETVVKPVETTPKPAKKDAFQGVKSGFAKVVSVFSTFLLVAFMTAVGFFAGWLAYDKFIDEDDSPTQGASEEKTIVVEKSDIVAVVEKSMDSVVSIAVSTASFDPDEGFVDVNSKIGSGFVVDKSGLIITNQHVVSDINADYVVVTNDGEEYTVVDIQRDDVNDIALVKVKLDKDKELKALSLGDSQNLKVGQSVIAIGTPLGEYAGSVTTGVISGLNRSVTTSSGGAFNITTKSFENVIQTDAAVNPGNSGGPLLDGIGSVVGINFATTASADNISFAIPINFVKDRLEEYRKYGKFRHPTLGIAYEPISESQARFYQNLVAGALVVGITADGPADKAGLEKYDIIMEVDGKSVDNNLRVVIMEYEVGEKVTLKVWRDGETKEIAVTLGEA